MAKVLDAGELGLIFPEISQIQNAEIRKGVEAIWVEIAAEMMWASLEEIPKNMKGESGRSLVQHIRGVTQTALAICEVALAVQGKAYNRDLLIAACLLHDSSKPVEYEPDPSAISTRGGVRAGRKSKLGEQIQHAAYATHKIWQKSLPLELAHLVLTHTHGSGMRGQTWEAAALFYADFADTDAALHSTSSSLYIQRWKL